MVFLFRIFIYLCNMPKIDSYANSSPVTTTSKFLGTDADNETVNFQASDVAAFVLGASNGTLQTKSGAVTISGSDANTFIQYNTNGGTITLPDSGNTDFPVGAIFQVQFIVAGTMAIAAGALCTLNGTNTITTQWNARTVRRISSTVWTIY